MEKNFEEKTTISSLSTMISQKRVFFNQELKVLKLHSKDFLREKMRGLRSLEEIEFFETQNQSEEEFNDSALSSEFESSVFSPSNLGRFSRMRNSSFHMHLA